MIEDLTGEEILAAIDRSLRHTWSQYEAVSDKARAALALVPDRPPMEGDEMPA
jgi:hypothetical protein